MARIRTLLAVSTALAVISFACYTESQAQAPGGGGGPRGGGFMGGGPGGGGFGGGAAPVSMLIRSPEVQKEVKLTEKQITQLDEAQKKMDDQRRSMFESMRNNNNNNNGGGRPDFTAMQETMTALGQQSEKIVSKILAPAQYQRVKQIGLQREGVFAVARPDMAEKLNMDEEQIAAVQQIMQEMQGTQRTMRDAQQREMFSSLQTPEGGRPSREAIRAKMDSPEFKAVREKSQAESETLRKQAKAAIAKVLSKKQKAAFDRMLGEPFDTTTITFNFGNRGPGGRGPGGRDTAKKAEDDSDDAKAAPPAAKAADPVKSAATAKPKRKSLKERRAD